jgi:hypothetical protein
MNPPDSRGYYFFATLSLNTGESISSGARAREGDARTVFPKDGSTHDSNFQNPSHPLYSVAENSDHFWWLKFIQKLGDCL